MLQHPHCDRLTENPQLRLLLLQHLDHARKILPTVPRNAVRRVDRAGHAAQGGAGFDGGGVFLRKAQVFQHQVGAKAAGVALAGVHENAPASKGYAGGFGTDLMLKDLGLSQENAMAMKATTPLGGMARAIYAAHSIAGHGSEDFSSVIKIVQKKA